MAPFILSNGLLITNISNNMIKILNFLFNPGVRLVYIHRLVYWMFQYKVLRGLSLLVWQLEVALFATHISPRCYIPKTTIFPHPTGIVLGDYVTLGENVIIYQNVTIGLKKRTEESYPTIDNDVVIYAGAVVVGDIHIGSKSKIGANTYVAKSTVERQIIKPLTAHS
jgi:serine O-acetyltransferase